MPLRAMLYVRQQTMATRPACRSWRFRTKRVLGAELVEWVAGLLNQEGKTLRVVVDGGYTKRPFLQPVIRAGVVVVGRLRKDAALRDLPPPLKKGSKRRPGRPRRYGRNRISLAKRAGQGRGWQTVLCVLYNQETTKTCKTFLATYPPAGGVIRVVLVRELQGWFAFFSTDANTTACEILETFADRTTIEQDFHDIKEVWGAGQQQVRNIWTNVAVYHLNLWMHTLVELWAWDRSRRELCDRRDSPWDDALRRPSHADRRKALRRLVIQTALSALTRDRPLPAKIRGLLRGLMALAA